MITPTCEYCGVKFPGDPCIKCGVPSGLSKGDLVRFKVSQVMEKSGISQKAAKRQLTRNRRTRKKHGRQ